MEIDIYALEKQVSDLEENIREIESSDEDFK